MVDRVLKLLLTRLRFSAARLPWLAVAAMLLIAAAAGARVIVLPAREAAVDDAGRELARFERSLRQQAADRASAKATPDQARQKLLERFPSQSQLNAELGRLLELTGKAGVALARGDYRLVPEKDGLFDRYLLNLPVKGQYAQIRSYLAAVRSEFPELAIDDITLRRDNIGSAEVEAQLRFILFARRPAS